MKSNACLSLLNMLNVLNAPLLLLVQNTKCAFTITGVIRGTSQTKLYSELGLESLKFRRWFRRLCTFFKAYVHNFLSNFIFSPNDSPSKTMKNVFYFI